MTLPLVLDVQPHRPCITSFWVWLQMCLALQEGVALPKHLFWAALSLWQNGWGMWIPFHRRALSSVVRGIWRWYARWRYREWYCLAVLPNILDVYCHGIEASFWLWPLGSRKWRSTWWAMSLIYSGPTTSQDDEISFRPHWQVHKLVGSGCCDAQRHPN